MSSVEIENEIVKKYGKGEFDPLLYKMIVELKTAVIEEFSEAINGNRNEQKREVREHN